MYIYFLERIPILKSDAWNDRRNASDDCPSALLPISICYMLLFFFFFFLLLLLYLLLWSSIAVAALISCCGHRPLFSICALSLSFFLSVFATRQLLLWLLLLLSLLNKFCCRLPLLLFCSSLGFVFCRCCCCCCYCCRWGRRRWADSHFMLLPPSPFRVSS